MILFPVIQCNELYAEEIAKSDFYATEFSDSAWLCPDVRKFEIYNNPFLFPEGKNMVLTVNDCTVATQLEAEQGIAPYSNATCWSYADAQEYIPHVRVEWKIMAQNFNPKNFKDTGTMQSVIKRRFNSDLNTEMSISNKFGVIKNDIRLFDDWFIDIRDFLFFMPDYLNTNPDMNIYTFSFDYLGQAIFNQELILNYFYGYYSLDLS